MMTEPISKLTFSVNALSRITGKDRRTVTKAVDQIMPAKQGMHGPEYHLIDAAWAIFFTPDIAEHAREGVEVATDRVRAEICDRLLGWAADRGSALAAKLGVEPENMNPALYREIQKLIEEIGS